MKYLLIQIPALVALNVLLGVFDAGQNAREVAFYALGGALGAIFGAAEERRKKGAGQMNDKQPGATK